MNLNDLKQLLKLPPLKAEGRKPHPILIWSILIAIIFLAISGFSDDNKKNNPKTETKNQPNTQGIVSQEAYLSQLETRLICVLQEISGAGKVEVFLNMENSGSKELATDVKTESEESTEEEQNEVRHQKDETVVFVEDNSGQSPYIIEEKVPQPSGVLVVAEGARVEHVKMEIYEAVRALFGLPAHRIKVTY